MFSNSSMPPASILFLASSEPVLLLQLLPLVGWARFSSST
jgi:hypothetical protein